MPDKDRTANLSRMDDQLSVLAGIAIVHSDLKAILAGCVDCTDREKVYAGNLELRGRSCGPIPIVAAKHVDRGGVTLFDTG